MTIRKHTGLTRGNVMGQKITKELIHQLRVSGDYQAAHAAALKYKLACRELLCKDIGDNHLAVRQEHGFISHLIDIIEKELVLDNRKKQQARKKREQMLSERMTSRWGTEYDNGCSEYHIDPEILAAAENVEVGFDRKFR